MSHVALITAQSAFEKILRQALGMAEDGQLRRWREEYLQIDPAKVVAEMVDEQATVVCLGPGLDELATLELAAAFDRDHPEICVLLVADPTADLRERGMQAGVRDIIAPRAGAAEIRATVRRAAETAERRRANLIGPATPATPASKVVTLVSPKGGSGKTTVAVNVAVGLARRRPGGVVVVDLDLQFGDVAAALQMRPEHSIADLARLSEPVDATMAKVYLTAHPSSLWALCSPEVPADAEDVAPSDVSKSVELLASEFPFVVVDTGAGLHEETLAALDVATDVVFVCPMDVAGVRSLRKELDALERLGLTAARRHLVLNRADSRVGLTPADVEDVLGMKVSVSIPSSRAVPLSLNEGVPVVETGARTPVGRQLLQLVELLCPDERAPLPQPDGSSQPSSGRPGMFRRRREGS